MAFFFIRRIWQDKADNSAHSQFIRFSKGIYQNRAAISISRNEKCKLTGSYELANDLVNFVFSLKNSFKVNGILLTRESPANLLKELGIKSEIKKKARLYESLIDSELNSEQVKKISEIAYYMLFECSSDNITLKMKKKLPRSVKEGKEKVDDKFCILEAGSGFFEKIKEEFAFGLGDFKKVKIRHHFEIKDIILPKDEKDFEMMRLKAKRKGKLTREIEINGEIIKQEKQFEA